MSTRRMQQFSMTRLAFLESQPFLKDSNSLRWLEYCYASRHFNGKLGFVFHVEAIAIDKVFQRLLEVGKLLRDIRPTATVTTPLSPHYGQIARGSLQLRVFKAREDYS